MAPFAEDDTKPRSLPSSPWRWSPWPCRPPRGSLSAGWSSRPSHRFCRTARIVL